MKRSVYPFVLASVFGLFQPESNAQTVISSGPVSGTWNIAGSPYIVTVPINVAAGQALTVLPGVTVKFMPDMDLTVDGQLIAEGTSVLPIVFEANDTTSWGDAGSNLGGWGGIRLNIYYDPTPDLTAFSHCIVRDIKATPAFYGRVLWSDRCIKIMNCDFYHNRTYGQQISLYTGNAADTTVLDQCTMTNSFAGTGPGTGAGFIQTANLGGYTKITNCEFSYNHGSSLIFSPWTNILIENNLIHHNDQMFETDGAISLHQGTATVRGNKIYFNQCGRQAGLGCNNCSALIENNLICNNTNLAAFCGSIGGGGGMFITGNNSFSDPYIIRNNIIANNFYNDYYGGGLFIFCAQAYVSNNHFINNSTGFGATGSSISIMGVSGSTGSKVYLKNNLFNSVFPSGGIEQGINIFCAGASEFLVENNYLPSTIHQSIYIHATSTLIGDTLTNVIGTLPQMILPTTDNDFTTDATTADFNLLFSSPCINAGDITGCFPAVVDYAGANRISNGLIDIGAFEYQHTTGITGTQGEVSKWHAFPNPATNAFTLDIEKDMNEGEITITDLNGGIIHTSGFTNERSVKVNTHDFSPGVYFITLQSGVFSETKKMVIVK